MGSTWQALSQCRHLRCLTLWGHWVKRLRHPFLLYVFHSHLPLLSPMHLPKHQGASWEESSYSLQEHKPLQEVLQFTREDCLPLPPSLS